MMMDVIDMDIAVMDIWRSLMPLLSLVTELQKVA